MIWEYIDAAMPFIAITALVVALGLTAR